MIRVLTTLRGLSIVLVLLALSACELRTTTPTPQATIAGTENGVLATATETAQPEASNTSTPTDAPPAPTATSFEVEELEKGVNPLTGLPVDELALLERRPVAVKITSYPRSNRLS